jgi:flagellar motor protein MotB
MLRKSSLFGLAGVLLILAGCASSRVQNLTKATHEALSMVKQETERAIKLTEEKVKSSEVDADIGQQIIENLESTQKKVDAQLVQVAAIEQSKNREEILQFAERTNVVIQSALTDLKSLNDLYDVATFSQFETATFFPTGGYTIPPEKMDEAKLSMEPIVQRIIKFIGEHPNQRFVAAIVCYGFSDETPVGKESPLYKNLLEKMDNPAPSTAEMNKKLSELRAKSIAKLLVDIIKVNEGLIPDPRLINYDIKWLGKGESLPYPDKITDYKAVDKRRRMVSLIWNVLPGSLYIKNLTEEPVTKAKGSE